MLVPASSILKSLREELAAFFGHDLSEASSGQSLTAAVRLLEVRESGGTNFLYARLEALEQMLRALLPMSEFPVVLKNTLEQLAGSAREAREQTCLADLEAACERLVSAAEAALGHLVDADGIAASLRLKLAATLSKWEIADRHSLTAAREKAAHVADTAITGERVERYLRDRFGEPALSVTKFQPLPGGFGKQTILLQVEGRALSGSLVMRRDPQGQIVDNDCHRVSIEFPVIRAAFERGFPAPEALWLDTEHPLLPGGDFIVMRRAPGQTGGNVFRATAELSSNMVQVLAEGIARLHALPPCEELGDLTSSICTAGWNLTLRESIYRYVRSWYEIYMSNAHNPSPTLVSIYGWLLDNVPDPPGRPVLLHGDIGFHNMLIDEGRLSALVDWEFAHLGDPAEDVGYVKNTSAGIPWDAFVSAYRAAGGMDIDPVRLHFFQVWGQARNASASNLAMGKFGIGEMSDLKLAYTGHFHFPHFIQAACDLIEAGPGGATRAVGY